MILTKERTKGVDSMIEDYGLSLTVTGTLMWYYYICHRQVWLMAHQICPSQEDTNILIGKQIDETSYLREKKEINFNGVKFDILSTTGDTLVLGEVKKSSGSLEAAQMQLLLYLKILSDAGFDAKGELRIPEERKRIKVELDDGAIRKLEESEKRIIEIVQLNMPPPVINNKWCKKCAYNDFCFA